MKLLVACALGAIAIFLLLALLMFPGCSQPAPKPTPVQAADAGVSDLFTEYLRTAKLHAFNCRLPVVAVERDSAVGDVRGCLLQGDAGPVNDCTVKQATTNYAQVSVACLVRDVGARCNSAWLAGAADPAEKACADAARLWILLHGASYISVEPAP